MTRVKHDLLVESPASPFHVAQEREDEHTLSSPRHANLVNKFSSRIGLRVTPSEYDVLTIQQRADQLVTMTEEVFALESCELVNPLDYELPKAHFFLDEIKELINDASFRPSPSNLFRLASFVLERSFKNVSLPYREALKLYFCAVKMNVVKSYKAIANISQIVAHSSVIGDLEISKDEVKMIEKLWLRVGTDIGDNVCASNLGIVLMLEKSYDEAYRVLKVSARQGNYIAMNNVACCYLRGYGVETDGIKGLRWLKKAAKSNSSIAKFNIATVYANGIAGIGVDERRADRFMNGALNLSRMAADLPAVRDYLKAEDVDYTKLLMNSAMMMYV